MSSSACLASDERQELCMATSSRPIFAPISTPGATAPSHGIQQRARPGVERPCRIGFTSVECDGGNVEGPLAALLARPRRVRPRHWFVDATFALALTLLVTTLDVDDPRVAFSSLGALDDAVGEQFVAFAIAFAVIASYWLQHHRLIASSRRSTTPPLWSTCS